MASQDGTLVSSVRERLLFLADVTSVNAQLKVAVTSQYFTA